MISSGEGEAATVMSHHNVTKNRRWQGKPVLDVHIRPASLDISAHGSFTRRECTIPC